MSRLRKFPASFKRFGYVAVRCGAMLGPGPNGNQFCRLNPTLPRCDIADALRRHGTRFRKIGVGCAHQVIREIEAGWSGYVVLFAGGANTSYDHYARPACGEGAQCRDGDQILH